MALHLPPGIGIAPGEWRAGDVVSLCHDNAYHKYINITTMIKGEIDEHD